jgi:hypothetical protein
MRRLLALILFLALTGCERYMGEFPDYYNNPPHPWGCHPGGHR